MLLQVADKICAMPGPFGRLAERIEFEPNPRQPQRMPQASEHHDLSPVMRFMRGEVRQHVADIQRQVAPRVGARRWHAAIRHDAEFKQRFHACTASFQRNQQLAAGDCPQIDEGRDANAMLPAKRLEPAGS